MSDTYPQVRDTSTVTGVFNLPQFLGVGIEGQAFEAGTIAVGTPKRVKAPADADTWFGAGSPLALLVKFMLNQGLNFVDAIASIKDDDDAPDLTARRAAWNALEENPDVRIRMTDSMVQANLVALADSCEFAEGIQNKQFCIGGLATPSTSNNLITAATAMASKRGVLVGPGIYDSAGVLRNGMYVAGYAAAMIAKNPDITDDLDTVPVPGTVGIETASNGMPLFRLRAGAGTPVNDFQVLLDGGVSPFRQGRNGGAEVVHFRTTYTTDDTFDALMTLLIKDEVFIGIRGVLEAEKFLRRGNTENNQSLVAAIVNSWLSQHSSWVLPKVLPDGTQGYGVTVVPSTDSRKMIVSWQAEIVRNTQTIDLSGEYTVAV